MSAILGFLFSRWTLLIAAVVIVMVLVNAGKLVFNKYVIAGLLTLAVGIGLWSWHDHLVTADRLAVTTPYIDAIKKANDEAVVKLKEETAKTDAATKALKEFSTRQEGIDHANTETITALNSKLRNTRLRDPGKTGGCGGGAQGSNPASADNSAASAGAGDGLFSIEASDFLWDFALTADRVNEALRSCRAYAQEVKTLIAETESGGIVLAVSEWSKVHQ